VTQLPDELPGGVIELRRSWAYFIDEVMNAVARSFPELHQRMLWCKTMPFREDVLTFLQEDEKAFESNERWGYALFETNSGELVGSAGLRRISETDSTGLEIGYWVRSDRTKRGYATAAGRALMDATFEVVPGIERVRISMDAANVASAAVPRRLGFAFLREVPRERSAAGHTGIGAIWELERAPNVVRSVDPSHSGTQLVTTTLQRWPVKVVVRATVLLEMQSPTQRVSLRSGQPLIEEEKRELIARPAVVVSFGFGAA
jgi:RimJ/RimL family protein N-acetyltransferase